MSRQRFIYPQICTSEDVTSLSFGARLLFIGLIATADDYGRGKGSARAMKSEIFPADDCLQDVDGWASELKSRRLVTWYEIDCSIYYQIRKWDVYQRPKYKAASLIPPIQHDAGLGPEVSPNPATGSNRVEEKRREERCNGVGLGGDGEGRVPALEVRGGGPPPRQGGINKLAAPETSKPEEQSHYLPKSLRSAIGNLAMAKDHSPGESKRRRDEAKRRQLNTHAVKKSPEEQAWEVVTLCVAEPNPDKFTANAQIKAAVAAIGGWEYLAMAPDLDTVKHQFLTAYKTAAATPSTTGAA